MDIREHFDGWSLAVIAITLVLFLVALVVKGLTHERLLAAGVFVVSVKLILMGYKNSLTNDAIQHTLDTVLAAMRRAPARVASGAPQAPGAGGDERPSGR